MTIKTRKTGPKTPAVSFFGYVYSNSCGYCKEFEPIWNELVPLLTAKNIKHGRFEAGVVSDKDIKLKSGGNVETNNGVPNIFKVVNHNVQYYTGERTAPAIMKWLDVKTPTFNTGRKLFPGLKGGQVRFNSRTKKRIFYTWIYGFVKKEIQKNPFFQKLKTLLQ